MSPTIVHIITNLSSGGAERMLYKLLAESTANDDARFQHVVLSMVGKEYIGEKIEALGIPVHTLGLKRASLPSPKVLFELLRLVRKYEPSVLQGWMYHGNLAAWFAAKMMRGLKPALSFNIRHSISDIAHEKPLSRLVIRLGARAARSAQAVIYNSRTSATQHEKLGYPSHLRKILPNGFDLEIYQQAAMERESVRAELGFSAQHFVMVLIGRFHPMKDHETFFRAAHLLKRDVPDARFVLVGRETDSSNSSLVTKLQSLGLENDFILLGERTDVPQVLAGVDVLTSCSAWGEGFSNVIGEACASSRPVVVTDVGDALDIVGEHGRELVIGDAEGLTAIWRDFHQLGTAGRAKIGESLRSRVADRFSIAAVTKDYLKLFEHLSTNSPPR